MWNTYSWPKRMVNVKVEKIDTWSIYGNWSLVKKHIFPNGGEFFMVMFIPWDRTASVKKVTKKLNKSFTLPETNITPQKMVGILLSYSIFRGELLASGLWQTL